MKKIPRNGSAKMEYHTFESQKNVVIVEFFERISGEKMGGQVSSVRTGRQRTG